MGWQAFSTAQVDSAVAAMDLLSAAIEEGMPREALLSLRRDAPLLTDAELDAAAVPESCFIRSFLTRIKTPRFKTIVPGLNVPHDASTFAAHQKFTNIPTGLYSELYSETTTIMRRRVSVCYYRSLYGPLRGIRKMPDLAPGS